MCFLDIHTFLQLAGWKYIMTPSSTSLNSYYSFGAYITLIQWTGDNIHSYKIICPKTVQKSEYKKYMWLLN